MVQMLVVRKDLDVFSHFVLRSFSKQPRNFRACETHLAFLIRIAEL